MIDMINCLSIDRGNADQALEEKKWTMEEILEMR